MTKEFSSSKKIKLNGTKTYSLDKLPDLIHGVNCPCCSGNSDNDFKDSSDITYATNGSFQTMANYLTTGFWSNGEFGGGSREWNLGSSGNNPQGGSISYSLGTNYNDNNGIANALAPSNTKYSPVISNFPLL